MFRSIISVIMFSISFFFISGAPGGIILKSSGASFPYPLYKEWIKIYESKSNDRISYESIGSGKGIRNFLDRITDFGGTDAYLSEEEMKTAPSEVLHIPTCLGAVVIFYNLPGNPGLKLTPELIVDIFSGKINNWSDKRIAEVNPGVKLPDRKITVIHRSDGSGTTFIFTNYLSAVSPYWKETVGCGKKVNWPYGMGVETNPRIVTFVEKVPGAVGYGELTYALNANLPTASIQNRSGRFIKPTLESVSAAADTEIPPDTRILIVDTQSPKGYPISGFTWYIFYKEQSYNNRTKERASALGRYLWWAIHDGQQFTKKLSYAPLSKEAVHRAEGIIRSMTYDGEAMIDW